MWPDKVVTLFWPVQPELLGTNSLTGKDSLKVPTKPVYSENGI